MRRSSTLTRRFSKTLRPILLLLALMLAAPVPAALALTVASGAGYKRLVDEVAAAFTAATGRKVELVYGNMGQIIAQAKAGGVVDLIAGDRRRFEESTLDIAGYTDIGRGRLVVAFAKDVTLAAPKDVANAGIKRLAMPDPKKAIYGRACAEFLNKAGLADTVKDKLLVVGTVPQVTAYLVSREVDAGCVNLTDAMGAVKDLGGYLPVDESLYSPIVITVGQIKGATDTDGIKAFLEFLATPEVADIVKRHGL